MDKKKAAKLEQMEAEMARLWEQSQNETDNKKKQKLIQNRNKLQWKAAAMRSGRKLSKQTRDDLVAYSFIAPNFIGFAVFTLIPFRKCLYSGIYGMGWKQPDSVCRTFQFLETAVGYFFHGILKKHDYLLCRHGTAYHGCVAGTGNCLKPEGEGKRIF